MNTSNKYEVKLWEDKVRKNDDGKIIHHPLNGIYTNADGRDRDSYGYLSFGGHQLAVSQILRDVNVFRLEFSGEPEETQDREEWADKLRFDVLSRLTGSNRCWYLSMIDGPVADIRESLSTMLGEKLNPVIVESEKPYGYGYGFISRPFFEIPNRFLSKVVPYIWSRAVPGYPIEGYNMKHGQIEILKRWDTQPRNDQLLRQVCDHTFVSFYTYPAEHSHFSFVTNKLNYLELAAIIKLDELQAEAENLEHNI